MRYSDITNVLHKLVTMMLVNVVIDHNCSDCSIRVSRFCSYRAMGKSLLYNLQLSSDLRFLKFDIQYIIGTMRLRTCLQKIIVSYEILCSELHKNAKVIVMHRYYFLLADPTPI